MKLGLSCFFAINPWFLFTFFMQPIPGSGPTLWGAVPENGGPVRTVGKFKFAMITFKRKI
jgi:hypothetical protein